MLLFCERSFHFSEPNPICTWMMREKHCIATTSTSFQFCLSYSHEIGIHTFWHIFRNLFSMLVFMFTHSSGNIPAIRWRHICVMTGGNHSFLFVHNVIMMNDAHELFWSNVDSPSIEIDSGIKLEKKMKRNLTG